MSSLTDIIASAKSQIKNDLGSNSNSIKGTLAGAIQNSKQEVANIVPTLVKGVTGQVTGGINNAINTGLDSVKGAAMQAVTGNFSGAIDTLVKSPGEVLGSLASSFGLGKGGSLTGPSNGGVTPGNGLGGALARADPQLSFNWWAQLPDVTPIGGNPVSLPWFYCEEATPPFRTFSTRSIFRNGHNQHYPGPYDVDALRLTLYNDIAGKTLAYLNAWQGGIMQNTTVKDAVTQTGGYGRSSDHKRNIKIYLLNPSRGQIATLEYIGCWPTTIDAYSLDSGTSTRIVSHVTFSVDDVIVTVANVQNSTISGFLGNAITSVANSAITSLLSSLA